MTKKEFLNQAYAAYREIDDKLEQIARLRELACRVTSVISPTGVTGNGQQGSRVENSLIKVIDEPIAELRNDIDKLMRIRSSVANAISQIKNREERIILEYRYLAFKSWNEISRKMNFSPAKVFQLHKNALQNLIVK